MGWRGQGVTWAPLVLCFGSVVVAVCTVCEPEGLPGVSAGGCYVGCWVLSLGWKGQGVTWAPVDLCFGTVGVAACAVVIQREMKTG